MAAPSKPKIDKRIRELESDVRKVQQEEQDIKNASGWQELWHKDRLMSVVSTLAIGSFLLLSIIVLFQMVMHIFRPKYIGISDDVIKVIAVSVFGQVIVVVGALATYLFKKS